MPIDQETLNLLRTALLATATVLLIAKICRECGAEGLRRRLRLLETELFELGRNRHVGFHDPAYTVLSRGIRSISQFSQEISLTRFAMSALFRRSVWTDENVRKYSREWEAALSQVQNPLARKKISHIHERVLLEVTRHLVMGSIPFAVTLYDFVTLHTDLRKRLAILTSKPCRDPSS